MLLLAADTPTDFTMATRDVLGLLFIGALITVLWLLYRRIPGLTPGEDEKKKPPPPGPKVS
jgi:hypothetical protein